MAKSKTFFSTRHGSTKSHTFTCGKIGKDRMQITKDRQDKPQNPQTDAQMEARLRLAMVSRAEAELYDVIENSFQGKKGSAAIKEFRRMNLKNGALNVVSWPEKGKDNGLSDFQISKGTLPSHSVFFNENFGTAMLVSSTFVYASTEDEPDYEQYVRSLVGLEEGETLLYVCKVAVFINDVFSHYSFQSFTLPYDLSTASGLDDGHSLDVTVGNFEILDPSVSFFKGYVVYYSIPTLADNYGYSFKIIQGAVIKYANDGKVSTEKMSTNTSGDFSVDFITIDEAKATYKDNGNKSGGGYLNAGNTGVDITGGRTQDFRRVDNDNANTNPA